MDDRVTESLMDREALKEAILRWRDRAIRAEERLESAERQLRRADDRVHSLVVEVRGLRNGLPPVTLEALAAAYAAAEVPTAAAPVRAGDVMIYPIPDGHSVRKALVDEGLWRSDTRILSRAPRKPWADLAEALAGVVEHSPEYIEGLARDLHAAGWRKGGDDDE